MEQVKEYSSAVENGQLQFVAPVATGKTVKGVHHLANCYIEGGMPNFCVLDLPLTDGNITKLA